MKDMNVFAIIEAALQEDIGAGDVTSDSLVPENAGGKGYAVAKEPLVLAGINVAGRVFKYLDPQVTFTALVDDSQADGHVLGQIGAT